MVALTPKLLRRLVALSDFHHVEVDGTEALVVFDYSQERLEVYRYTIQDASRLREFLKGEDIPERPLADWAAHAVQLVPAEDENEPEPDRV